MSNSNVPFCNNDEVMENTGLTEINSPQKDIFIYRLLRGIVIPEEFDFGCSRFGFDASGRYFNVVALYQEITDVNYNNGGSTMEDLNKIQFTIADVLNEADRDFPYKLNLGNVFDSIVIIISADEEALQSDEIMDDKVCCFTENIIKACEVRCGIVLRAFIGQFFDGVSGIYSAYREAMEIKEYSDIVNINQKVICYGQVTSVFTKERSDHIQKTNKLNLLFRNQVQTGIFGDAIKTLHSIYDHIFTKPEESIQLVMLEFSSFKSDIVFMIDNMRMRTNDQFPGDFDPMPEILYKSKSAEDVMKKANEIYTDYEQFANTAGLQNSPPAWLDSMQNYILEHLEDPNLNISTLSDALKLNAAYSARIFSKYFGCSVLDYIHTHRIEKAIHMIQSGMLIKDVAVAVGYDNPLRMSRAFKRYRGILPQEIKQS